MEEETREKLKLHPVKEITYGAISGMVGKLVEFPFDTIKVRLQSSQSHNASTLRMISQTYHNEGVIHGFYKGLKAPLLGACLETAVLFSSYNYASTVLAKQLGHCREGSESIPLWNKCVSGGFAGFMASFILTPVELVKCQLQVSNMATATTTSKNQSHSYSSVIQSTLRDKGVTGLWKGLESTMIREVVGTSIWFGSYEYINAHFNSAKNPVIKNKDLQLLFSGAMAGVAFNLSMFPVDTIKSNIQTYDILNKTEHKHINTDFWKETRKLLRLPGGIMNLYKGLGITMVRCIPANALIFYTYEILKRNF
ncbi:uncharacterized protein LODBEIA_P36150 [Lodderomyces beijingensis]|uniref:Mitochondrial thiamine pyrophosphate carrier 1 n=1 Tax=Lodderomyces beijingensis TaxID=1775926 RepID=A0ABP0ZR45_9ASCO